MACLGTLTLAAAAYGGPVGAGVLSGLLSLTVWASFQ